MRDQKDLLGREKEPKGKSSANLLTPFKKSSITRATNRKGEEELESSGGGGGGGGGGGCLGEGRDFP